MCAGMLLLTISGAFAFCRRIMIGKTFLFITLLVDTITMAAMAFITVKYLLQIL